MSFQLLESVTVRRAEGEVKASKETKNSSTSAFTPKWLLKQLDLATMSFLFS